MVKEHKEKISEVDEDLSDIETSSALGPDEIEESLPLGSGKTWPQLVASLIFLLGILVGLAIAAFGVFILLYSLLTRSYIPARAHLVKDLYFDYRDSRAVATADFRDSLWGSAKDGIQSLPLGTKVTIWMELEAAETQGNVNKDMFQVLAQILTSDDQVAASVSRPCVLTSWSPLVASVRSLIAAPAVLLGLWREHQVLRIPLFSRYPDQPDKPLQSFRAILKATGSSGHLPHLYSAKVNIQLALGFVGRILYWLRPGKWNFLALLAISASTVAGGLMISLVSGLIYFSLGATKAHAPPHSPPHSDNESDAEDGSLTGMSREASALDLKEVEPKRQKEKAFLAGATLPDVPSWKEGQNSKLWNKDAVPSAPELGLQEKRRWAEPSS